MSVLICARAKSLAWQACQVRAATGCCALIGAVPRRGEILLESQPLARTPAACWAQGLAYVPRERRSEGLMLSRALEETITLPHPGGAV